MNKKAIVAMSGGVDSSVAAYLMKTAGYSCLGVTMKLFSNEEIGVSREHSCCSLADVEDARSVADAIGIPHYVFNFSHRFQQDVLDRFVAAYENGATPNPCIDCNRYLKFHQLFLRARELDCDFVVTGHYAQIEYHGDSGRYWLRKAADPQKDQSYVLYALTQKQLAHVQFPLGLLQKTQVRAIAQSQGFVNAKKHDSQDICFVPNGRYADFIRLYTGKAYPPGDFLDPQGRVLGQHRGVIAYTIGQRKGLGLSLPAPLYVCGIHPTENTVVLGPEKDLFSQTLTAKDINLIPFSRLEKPLRLKAKVRYRQPEEWATVAQTGEDTLEIRFDAPQRAITKGQAVVFYDGDIVVGGGTIQ